jgi:uncharacterized protein YjeT (DUF2065 family)
MVIEGAVPATEPQNFRSVIERLQTSIECGARSLLRAVASGPALVLGSSDQLPADYCDLGLTAMTSELSEPLRKFGGFVLFLNLLLPGGGWLSH